MRLLDQSRRVRAGCHAEGRGFESHHPPSKCPAQAGFLFHNVRVRTRRIYLSGVVLGVTLAAALWLLTYRVWDVFEYIDRTGQHFRPSERVRVQPWWGVPATVAVLFTGLGLSLRLLPGGRGPIRRLADHLAR